MTKKEIIRCDVSNSITSIMSNVTAFAKKFILYYFPEEYFKDIYIVTSSASNEQALYDDNEEIPIKNYPLLSITPTYNQNYDDVSGGPFPMWRRGYYQGFKNDWTRYGYKKIFLNDIDQISISAIPNRVKFTFNFKIRLDSHLKKIDVCHMLRQKFNEGDKFYYNNVTMETQIPNVIAKAIANIKNYDLTDNDDVISFLEYLRTYSSGSLSQKIYTGSGLRSFVYTYLANILVSVQSAPDTDGGNVERNNMAEGKPSVEFSLDMELWIPNNYVFECNYLPAGDYRHMEDESKITIEYSTKLRPPKTFRDKSRINWVKFVTDINVKVDKLDINPLLAGKTIDFIHNRVEANDFDLLRQTFDFLVYRDDKILKYGKDFKINWNTLEIELMNPLFNYVYYVGIYANQVIMNDWFVKNKPY